MGEEGQRKSWRSPVQVTQQWAVGEGGCFGYHY